MSIASEITRLQGVKSDIITAIADKGVTVPSGSKLDDCPGLIADIPSGGAETVEILGRTYPVVTLGNLKWIALNLDYEDANISTSGNMSDKSNAVSREVENKPTVYGWNGYKCGKFYNKVALNYINGLNLNGWRIARVSDWDALKTYCSNNSNLAKKQWAWQLDTFDHIPLDTTGLGICGTGYANDTSTSQFKLRAIFWQMKNDGSAPDDQYFYLPNDGTTFGRYYTQYDQGYSIRLVKDA